MDGLRSFIRGSATDGEEARDKARVICRYAVRCTSPSGGAPYPASVVDISVAGMRLEGVGAMAKGDRLDVNFTQTLGEEHVDAGPVIAEVIWARKRAHDGVRLAGVRYLDPNDLAGTWVQLVLEEMGLNRESTAFQKRKHIRLATALRAELQDSEGATLAQGKVANLSVGGTLVQSENEVAEGTIVAVKISPYNNFPVFSVSAKVLQCRADGEKGHLLSLQFVQVNSKEIKILKQFVVNLVKGRSL